MSRQLHAGFIADAIFEVFALKYGDEALRRIRQASHHLCNFEVSDAIYRASEFDTDSVPSELCIIDNLISRGLPTKLSEFLESEMARVFDLTHLFEDQSGGFTFQIKEANDDLIALISRALTIIEPRISGQRLEDFKSWEGTTESGFERDFLYNQLPNFCGGYIVQMIEPQKELKSILHASAPDEVELQPYFEDRIDIFKDQRVDFALQFPYPLQQGCQGVIFEVDGSQHNSLSQTLLDEQRDGAVEKARWLPVRIKTNEWQHATERLGMIRPFLEQTYFKNLKLNFEQPLWESPEGMKVLHLALSPIAVARVQKTILDQVFQGHLKLDAKTWKIGVLERDVTCAEWALEDLKRQFDHLAQLQGKAKGILPSLELTVFSTEAFLKNPARQSLQVAALPFEQVVHYMGDVLIDIAVLERAGFSTCPPARNVKNRVTVRSAYSKRSQQKFKSARLIAYPTVEEKGRKSEALCFFLRNIFRKKDFRPGQLPIINRALQLQSVIGLLPTGGGKSLTYQICALLQPGVCLIVDPIKSLMKDQYDGLVRNGIDASVFINSSLKTIVKRRLANEKLQNGEVLFAFISPERMQMETFREVLSRMRTQTKLYFSYAVIDEAHCVSEWGHDFRTAYLRLGENLRRFCVSKIKKESPVSLFGLTATASFDVLSDVKRELDIPDEGVVRPPTELNTRAELVYKIIQTTTTEEDHLAEIHLSNAIGRAKTRRLKEVLTQLPADIQDSLTYEEGDFEPIGFEALEFYQSNNKKYQNAALVFCPHKSEKIRSGVKSVESEVRNIFPATGSFFGGDERDDDNGENSEKNQENFLLNNLNILIATKAFGMGIDKPNVRATIHFNHPSSIESFIQEAGRAGRDRKRALCYVLYSDKPQEDKQIQVDFFNNSFKGKEKEIAIIGELLTEIRYPIGNPKNGLKQAIEDEFGVTINGISAWPNQNPYRLYFNRGFEESYGFLQVSNDTFIVDIQGRHHSIEKEKSKQILEFAATYLKKYCPSFANLFVWMQSTVQSNPAPGIEQRLKDNPSEVLYLTVHFTNDALWRIGEILKIADARFDERLAEEAAGFCQSKEEYILNLNRGFRKRFGENITLDNRVAGEIKALFHNIRLEQDSFKAVYRLSIIGVVDDYEVDYSQKVLRLTVNPKASEAYVEALQTYLQRYQAPEAVERKLATIDPQKSVIQECVRILIEFIYDEIAKKRRTAIDSMADLCERGLSKEREGGLQIRKDIETYFNSKFLDEMRRDTDDGKLFDKEILFRYLNYTNGITDELEHLRGSAIRMLNDRPDNAAFLLMKAFSTLLLETQVRKGKLIIKSETLIDQATDDLLHGLAFFEEAFGNGDEVLNDLKILILNHNKKLQSIMDEIEQYQTLKNRTSWLKYFNQNFASNYELTR